MEPLQERLRELLGRLRVNFGYLIARVRGSLMGHDEPEDGEQRPPRRGRGTPPDATVIVATREDDVSSIIGRIDTAESLDVVLVVRNDARTLRRATAWPHIASHARRHGIELGVVSPRSDVRSFARTNGLPAARSPKGLRPAAYTLRVGERDIAVPPVPWGRIVRAGMILGFFGIVLIAGCYQVPSAQIRLQPASEPFSASGEARANAIVESSDLESGTITANTIRRQIFTAVTTTTTGEVEIGEEFATLELEFSNDGATVALVPLGTRVLDPDGVSFVTQENVDVPAGGSVRVPARAELPGVAGNVTLDTVTEAEDLPAAISVTNVTAGSGGTNVLTAGVAQEDVDRVREIADDVLLRIALATLTDAAESEELGTILPGSVSASVFSEQPVQLLDEPSDILVVEYTIIAAALVITPQQADDYGELLLREDLPEGQALIPGTVVATVTAPEERGEPVLIEATGEIAPLEGIVAIAGELTGKSPSEARALLDEHLSLAAPAEIQIHPNFIPWMWLPRKADNIEILIVGPEDESADEDESDSTATPTPTPTATTVSSGG